MCPSDLHSHPQNAPDLPTGLATDAGLTGMVGDGHCLNLALHSLQPLACGFGFRLRPLVARLGHVPQIMGSRKNMMQNTGWLTVESETLELNVEFETLRLIVTASSAPGLS